MGLVKTNSQGTTERFFGHGQFRRASRSMNHQAWCQSHQAWLLRRHWPLVPPGRMWQLKGRALRFRASRCCFFCMLKTMSFVVFTCGLWTFIFSAPLPRDLGPGRSTSKSPPTWSPTVGRSERPSRYCPDPQPFHGWAGQGSFHLNRSSNTTDHFRGLFEYKRGCLFLIGRYQ